MKKITLFFPLHPVPFHGQDYEKQKKPQLVTCLFELKSMFTKINFLVWPFEFGNWKDKEKKNKTLNISKSKTAC